MATEFHEKNRQRDESADTSLLDALTKINSDEEMIKYAKIFENKKAARETRSACLKMHLEIEIVRMVKKAVCYLLDKLYKTKKNPEFPEKWEYCYRRLYPEVDSAHGISPVGPVGERPIHVCALLAARYRTNSLESSETGLDIPNGMVQGYVAQGIVEAMKQFLDCDDWKAEAWEPYGKDYCAALASYFHKNEKVEEFPIPFMKEIKQWYDERKNPANLLPGDDNHIRATTLNGLYEGETILFPFVASGNLDAVDWLLNPKEKRFCQYDHLNHLHLS